MCTTHRLLLAGSIDERQNTSIAVRVHHLANTVERLKEIIGPLVSGLSEATNRFQITLDNYIERLNEIIRAEMGTAKQHTPNK